MPFGKNEIKENMVFVQLTKTQIHQAAEIGVCRYIDDLDRKPKWKQDAGAMGWQSHIAGALGEYAVSLWQKVFYDGNFMQFKAKDSGYLQVRATSFHRGELCYHPEDGDSELVVNARVHDLPFVCLTGWAYGKECKNQKYWFDPTGKNRHAYYVWQEETRSMKSLHDLITIERHERFKKAASEIERGLVNGAK